MNKKAQTQIWYDKDITLTDFELQRVIDIDMPISIREQKLNLVVSSIIHSLDVCEGVRVVIYRKKKVF